MSSSERGRRFPTALALTAAVVTSALAGCGGPAARPDSGTGSEIDARGPTVDAPIPPGTDAPMVARPDTGVPGLLCEDTCGTANDMECDDGGPMSMFSICAFGTDCMDCGPRDPADCMPRCGMNNCGDDGCGGTCGECTAPETCMAGTCGVCTPNCGTATCGGDGCGGSCGECAGTATCAAGTCRTPDCAMRECGSDGAGGTCGTMDGACAMGMGCRDGRCVACDCAGRACGTASGCDSCGECPMGMDLCDRLTGTCSAMASPAGCNDTCRFSGDNECDDGRMGSHTSLCEPGTDCTDCGPM